jgi:hypothetical protein
MLGSPIVGNLHIPMVKACSRPNCCSSMFNLGLVCFGVIEFRWPLEVDFVKANVLEIGGTSPGLPFRRCRNSNYQVAINHHGWQDIRSCFIFGCPSLEVDTSLYLFHKAGYIPSGFEP